MIPESFIQELLNRVDVVDVVERHVKLKRTGANYRRRIVNKHIIMIGI